MPKEVVLIMTDREALFFNVYLKSQMQLLQRRIMTEADIKNVTVKNDLRELLTIQDRLEKAIRGIYV